MRNSFGNLLRELLNNIAKEPTNDTNWLKILFALKLCLLLPKRTGEKVNLSNILKKHKLLAPILNHCQFPNQVEANLAPTKFPLTTLCKV